MNISEKPVMRNYTKTGEGEAMNLSYMQEISIRDNHGRCRCPYCGKYRRREDFHEQPVHIRFGDKADGGLLHVAPACIFCLKEKP